MQELLSQPIAEAIATHLETDVAQVLRLIGPPSRAGMGDLALPCFPLAKQRGVPPPQLAGELAELLSSSIPGLNAAAAGPFLNLTWSPEAVAAAMLPSLSADPTVALRSDRGAGKRVCVDFSSPNIAKHLAFHHIRSTMIGNALALCYAADGWDVTRINFLGDWGTAFGRLIAGWKREDHSLATLDQADNKVTFLNELYVRISQAAKADPAVMDEARAWSKKLEDGDDEARQLWQVFKDASLAEFQSVYATIGVEFDSWKGEAYYEDKMQPVLDELHNAGLLVEDDGAKVVDLSAEGFKKPVLIQRADGGTLYATRDLAACQDRFDEFAFDRSLYVVDLGQGLHFKEWFAVAKKLGKPYADRLEHIGFGIVLMWNDESDKWERTATRNGVPMLLVDVLQEAIDRAAAIIDDKNPELPSDEKQSVAEAVGIGAVVFNDLKNNRKGDVKFRFEDALAMQGDTGPYLQFAYARLCSIERKFAELESAGTAPNWQRLTRDDEKGVLLAIAAMRPALARVTEDDDPSQLATALLQCSGAVSSWLTAGSKDTSARVLVDDAELAATRVALVAAARGVIGEGLRLLGLRAPQRM